MGLLELDNAAFSRVCLDLLSKLPKERKVGNGYIPHLEIARLTLYSEDPRALPNLLDFAKNLPLAGKIELLGNIYNANLNNSIYFMGNFLDDVAVYEESEKDNEIYMMNISRFKKIELRNFAAYRILQILDIDLFLSEKTTNEEWEKVRAFVKNEIERRKELEKVK